MLAMFLTLVGGFLVIMGCVIHVIYQDDYEFMFRDVDWYLYPILYPLWFFTKLFEAH